ncbi:uncharacterized protein LOC119546239 [Drosophila subpulchrella]|uniref:uncharacterized protein LOC119546239 n=1 Tax=Drosophila subpulchrella TaxID=1486046 RepID=UPI0018A129CF|nr:uncharacterized protein LOC119546239 [Drosophila subpulchrella]
MQLFSFIFQTVCLFGCILALSNANCGAKYRGVGLCKMLITKVVYIPSENICKRVHITGCSADGTFFKSIKACETKCMG